MFSSTEDKNEVCLQPSLSNRVLSFGTVKTAAIYSKPELKVNVPGEDVVTVICSRNHAKEKTLLVGLLAERSCSYDEHYFSNTPIYELWLNHELVGLCDLNSKFKPFSLSSKDKYFHPIFIFKLEFVFIKHELRGQGLGSFFCDVIRQELIAMTVCAGYEIKKQSDTREMLSVSCSIVIEPSFHMTEDHSFFTQLFSDFNVYTKAELVMATFGIELSEINHVSLCPDNTSTL